MVSSTPAAAQELRFGSLPEIELSGEPVDLDGVEQRRDFELLLPARIEQRLGRATVRGGLSYHQAADDGEWTLDSAIELPLIGSLRWMAGLELAADPQLAEPELSWLTALQHRPVAPLALEIAAGSGVRDNPFDRPEHTVWLGLELEL